MMYTDYAIARIRAYLITYKVAKSRLARAAGVPEGCTRKIEDKDWNPTAVTLRALEGEVPEDFEIPTLRPKKVKTRSQ